MLCCFFPDELTGTNWSDSAVNRVH